MKRGVYSSAGWAELLKLSLMSFAKKENKMSKDERDNGNEFTFIKEQILPKRRSRFKKVCVSLGATLVLAVVFGTIARIAFILSEPFVSRLLGVESERRSIVLNSGEKELEQSKGNESVSSVSGQPSDPVKTQPQIPQGKQVTEVPPAIDPEKKEENGKEEKNKDKKEQKTVNNTYYVQKKVSADVQDFAAMYADLRRIANQSSTSIVNIVCAQKNVDVLENPYVTKTEAPGVVVAKDEETIFILTTCEKVMAASYLKAFFSGSVSADAKIEAIDDESGLAILSVQSSDLSEYANSDTKTAKLGESYILCAGTPVIAVGAPNGVSGSFDFGMVTNSSGKISIIDANLDVFYTNNVTSQKGEGFIVNLSGEIVGIMTNHFNSSKKEQICMAIGISSVKKLIEKLVNHEEQVYLGIIAEDMPADALADAEISYGIYVSEVISRSPAYDSGIQNGDIITSINDNPILGTSGLMNVKDTLKYRDEIVLGIVRFVKNTPRNMKIKLTVGKLK